MKKLIILAMLLVCTVGTFAQDKLYFIIEFMHVENDQEGAYLATEDFWEKIHQQRLNNNDIIGWDLWNLKPGGEEQGFQYATVTLFNDPVKMFQGGDFDKAMRAAYPNLSKEELDKTVNKNVKSRDLVIRIYLEQINSTDDKFDMPLGAVTFMNLIKVAEDKLSDYENMEDGIFRPMHQKEVNEGFRGSWKLLRYMAPKGSEVNANYMTFDLYVDYAQLFKNRGEVVEEETTIEQKNKIQKVLTLRDLKYQYRGTLIKKVR
jgi:hypothetical protein